LTDRSLYIYIPVNSAEVYVCGRINECCLCGHDGGLIPQNCLAHSLILDFSKDCPNVNVEMLFLCSNSH